MISNFMPGMGSLGSKIRADNSAFNLTIHGERKDADYIIDIIGENVNLVKKQPAASSSPSLSRKRKEPEAGASFTKRELKTFAEFLDETSYPYAEYREVRDDLIWRDIYDVSQRTLLHKSGSAISTLLTDSVPCVNCGFVFPLDNITVDHQRPQSGGVFSAILKVFRSMGLTLEGGKGFKSKRIYNATINGTYFTDAKSISINKPSDSGNRGRRYELSLDGILVYSVMKAITSSSILNQACMHNACNLSPLCNICNSSKNNTWNH